MPRRMDSKWHPVISAPHGRSWSTWTTLVEIGHHPALPREKSTMLASVAVIR